MPERNQEARRSWEMGGWRVRRRDWGADPAGRDPRPSGHPSCEAAPQWTPKLRSSGHSRANSSTPTRARKGVLDTQEGEFWKPTCRQRLWTAHLRAGRAAPPGSCEDPARALPYSRPIRGHRPVIRGHPPALRDWWWCVPLSPCLQGTACRCAEPRFGAPSPFDSARALPRASASARCKAAACRASHGFRHPPNGG
jgi:hypothetical protein